MKKSVGILALLLALGFTACNNEVDLTGDYEDTPIVYCLLNPDDSAHYIRIQKAFLVNGNVLETAQIPDSLKYDPADLDVEIQPLDANSGNPIGSPITFQYQPGMVQDTGTFATNGAMIYSSTASLTDLRRYRLQITNTKLNKVITSETGLVYSTSTNFFLNPNAGTIIFNPTSGNGYTIRWRPAINGFVYQPEIVFRWTEVDLTTGTQTPDSIVWTLTSKSLTSDQAPTEMDFNLAQNSFYRFLGENLEPKPTNIKRVIGTLSFKIYVGTEELNTYIEVNQPSIGLIQEKPVYTNINNGLGLFAGRRTFVKPNMPLAEASKDTLINSSFTENLNFTKN